MTSEENPRVETEDERIARLVEEALEEFRQQNKSIYAIAVEMLRRNVKALNDIKDLTKNDKV